MALLSSCVDKQNSKTLVVLLLCLYVAMGLAANSTDEKADRRCDENGDCSSDTVKCDKMCGCDRSAYVAVYYNETTKSCVVSFKHLMVSQLNIYGKNQEDQEDSKSADTMAEKIRLEAEKIFNTILISAMFFISCCAVCVISACLYCCRMVYSDNRLKSDVKALAKKLQRDHKIKKPTKKPTQPAHESCNVMCEEAGIFVV